MKLATWKNQAIFPSCRPKCSLRHRSYYCRRLGQESRCPANTIYLGRRPRESHYIMFRFKDFSNDDGLAKVMLRRPGRRAPCVCCQIQGSGFYSCHVMRGNPDFDFIANWPNMGGIDGLLARTKILSSLMLTRRQRPTRIQLGNRWNRDTTMTRTKWRRRYHRPI